MFRAKRIIGMRILLVAFALSIGLIQPGICQQVINQGTWRLVFADSQELAGENGAAQNAFDGKPGTIWHTAWSQSSPLPPHMIQIDLGLIFSISGFRYLPRQDGGVNGRIGQYEFYVSSNGVDWGTPAATGIFANDSSEKEVLFNPIAGRFICLRALSEINGNPWTSMAEINVLGSPGSGDQAPDGAIDDPPADISINAGDSLNFAGSGSDPDGDLPLRYSWSFGSGSGIPDSALEDPGLIQFNNPGLFEVTLAVKDAKGISDPTPAHRIIRVRTNTVPPISHNTWNLVYADSEELAGENGDAQNAFDGNPNTIWHTAWSQSNAPPPHEIQINLGLLLNISGFRYLPRQDGGINGRIKQYEFYTSIDGVNWGSPVQVGIFENISVEQEVLFAPVAGRFIRLRAISEINGNPWTSIAELNVLGSIAENYAPNGVIDSPSTDLSINVGEHIYFSGTGADPDNDLPLKYSWDFGSGITNSTLEDPGMIQFNIPGTYAVKFLVTDALGHSDPTPATRIITVNAPSSVIPDWSYVNSSPLYPITPSGVVNPVLTASDVTDASAVFVADPFLFYENGQWYMFFEVNDGMAKIGLATSSDGLSWNYQKIVLSGAQHFAFPQVFKYGGNYYMIPDHGGGNIDLYRATNFPYNWQYLTTLVSGNFADAAILFYNNTWWMFVGDTSNANQFLYYSDSLTSGWVQHPMSPIVSNNMRQARSAGRAIIFNKGTIVRFTQKNDIYYGEQVKALQIDTLTKTQYAEHEMHESPILMGSGVGWNAVGMHTFDPWWNGSEWICAVDGWNIIQGYQNFSIGIYKGAPQSFPHYISKDLWTLKYADSQELTGENGAATNAFDGRTSILWHTAWLDSSPPPPHEIQIDMGQSYIVSAFRYSPRQDGGINGRIAQFEFYLSSNGDDWGGPVAIGTFANSQEEKEVSFTPTTGRFIRLRALSEVNGNPWTSVGEISIIGQ
jgi:hypothetical protein